MMHGDPVTTMEAVDKLRTATTALLEATRLIPPGSSTHHIVNYHYNALSALVALELKPHQAAAHAAPAPSPKLQVPAPQALPPKPAKPPTPKLDAVPLMSGADAQRHAPHAPLSKMLTIIFEIAAHATADLVPRAKLKSFVPQKGKLTTRHNDYALKEALYLRFISENDHSVMLTDMGRALVTAPDNARRAILRSALEASPLGPAFRKGLTKQSAEEYVKEKGYTGTSRKRRGAMLYQWYRFYTGEAMR